MEGAEMRDRLSRIVNADRSNDRESKRYDRFMCAVIFVSLVPLMFAEQNSLALIIISWITVVIFFVDFLIRCYVSPIDPYKIGRPWWRRYPFTFMGVIDIMSILPIIGLINPKITYFRLFRLARIASIIKYARYTHQNDLLLRVLKKNLHILKVLSIIVTVYIFVSSLLIYNAEPPIDPETGEKTFSSFFDAIYWSVVTLTTVGYGDIYPVTMLGKIISVSLMIGGIGLIATLSSVVTAGLMEEINKGNQSSNHSD